MKPSQGLPPTETGQIVPTAEDGTQGLSEAAELEVRHKGDDCREGGEWRRWSQRASCRTRGADNRI